MDTEGRIEDTHVISSLFFNYSYKNKMWIFIL